MGEPYIENYSTLVFFVNGKKVVDDNVDPEWTLLYYLRNKLRLCGTKLGCAEGGCGACTVMVSKFNSAKQKIIHYAVNACLAPVCSMHGLAVTTVEGIGSTQTRLHPVQQRIALAHGSQCGFCTPGIVMSMYTLLRSTPASQRPSMKDIEVAFQGNLCRCTGYRPIIEGYRTFTEEWEKVQRVNGLSNGVCGMGEKCCKNQNKKSVCNGGTEVNVNGLANGTGTSQDVNRPAALFDPSEFLPYDSSQEPIFPSELQLSRKLDNQNLVLKGPKVTWHRPTNLEKMLNLKKLFPGAKIVNGNTEVGVEVKFKNFLYPVLIHPNQIPELIEVIDTDNAVKVGASVTLSDLHSELQNRITDMPVEKTAVFKEVTNMLHWFAGKQIRNVGVVGGNIMTGSPISDLNPIFMANKCKLHLLSEDHGKRIVHMDEKFWTGYRRNIVKPEEILTHIEIPHSQKNQYFRAYKQSKRREDDIAIVNAAFNLTLDDNDNVVNFVLAYGGMAPTTVITTKTGELSIGKKWNKTLLENCFQELMRELPLAASAPGGMIQYRQSLTLSLLMKFYIEVCHARNKVLSLENHKLLQGTQMSDFVREDQLSGKETFKSVIPKSAQYYQMVPETQEKADLIGRPVVHQSAFKQASGEAKYCDDMPRLEGEVYMTLVTSTHAYARLVSIDASQALAIEGVAGFFSAEDIDEKHNYYGHITPDETVFADKVVTAVGQIIGAVVADTQLIAQKAAKLVKIEYEDIHPAIITIEDAIREKSYYAKDTKMISRGDTESAFASAEHILTGEVRMGGQEHFYLETQACIANPKLEDNEMELICSTQHPTDIQHAVAHMLGIPSNRIVVKVKRMGGGFGGKESRSVTIALPLAYIASKLSRPVRCMLDRDEDILITGQRHPFLGTYKVAFESSGKITGLEMSLYANAGNSLDLSDAVMERAMLHMENCYYVPNVTCYGFVCRTNTVSNTAFRGFGGPQGMFFAEVMIRQMAKYLNKSVLELVELNLYKEGEMTPFNQPLNYCTLERCWNECLVNFDYKNRQKAVEEFNSKNRWRKRGIAAVPTKFGISFNTLFLNQAGALVLIYSDGSVLISHGGTEMGQGLHTKMLQVASKALGIPVDLIHISETSTDKVPNTSATAASSGSDLNGMAILNGCNTLIERLKPYKEANPNGTWQEWVKKAFLDRVCLSAAGFYKTPNIGYDFKKNSGIAFNYFTYGVACSEVEIDCLTGDHQVRRTDIVMDLGESLNPAIDIGQIEGAFMQGYGLFTIEEMMHSPEGLPYTRGPGTYKIPGFADIPSEFNVSLLKGAPNPRAIYSSKAVGEPPLFLASSIFFAIYEAVKETREERGLTEYFRFDSPATCARIRMACVDTITEAFPEPAKESFKPWNVTI